MGNMRRLPDNVDFGPEHFAQEKDFGFSGSAQGYDKHPVAPPFAGDSPTHGGMPAKNYAEGGKVEHEGGHHHPHGHHVTRVHHDPHTGMIIHHHAHGGYTMHHPDGSMTHHGADGQPAMAHGGGMHHTGHHQEGTHVGKMGGGEAPMVHDLDGDGMARGGGMRPRIPHGMKPKGMSEHSPVNTAPRNPMRNPSKRNAMPGGQMPYGVEPSAEPDDAGSEQGIPQLRHGGRTRERHKERE